MGQKSLGMKVKKKKTLRKTPFGRKPLRKFKENAELAKKDLKESRSNSTQSLT